MKPLNVALEEGDGTVISSLLAEHLDEPPSRSQPQDGSSVLIQSHWQVCVDTVPLAGVY